VDALVLKVREDGRVRSRGALVGIGVNTDGNREVLGLMLGDNESEASLSEFFGWLKSRGLRDVDLIVSDDHGGLVRAILDAPDMDTARLLFNQVIEAYETKAPKAMAVLEAGFEDATAVLLLPQKYRKRLRTTNGLERLNEEICRRERVIRIFPNRESALRLIGTLLMEIDEKWASGKKYLDMTDYLDWRRAKAPQASLKVTRIS